ncbi:methyl-accepting chemotaxis protein [Geminocystis sp. CENA526]|uniref:methyl-accepting chemotaxis protein n=1 Tax=Geminocystis sp. CENA526 TaxID=1355871 RepID=UPI003D6F4154
MTIFNQTSDNLIQNQSLSHSLMKKKIIRDLFSDLKQKFSPDNPSLSSRCTLRTQLLITVLPTVIVPLAIASSVAINFTQRQAKERLEVDTIQTLRLGAEATRQSMEDIFRVTDILEINPDVTSALKTASEDSKANKVPQQYPLVNQYLTFLEQRELLNNIILIEEKGNGIAYSNNPTDIVENTSGWWEEVSFENRRVIQPEFDEVSGTAFVTLIRSIKDPVSTSFLGITKVTKSIEDLNERIFDSLKVKISESQEVQVISASAGEALSTFTVNEATALGDVRGGEPLIEAIRLFQSSVTDAPEEPEVVIAKLQGKNGISNVNITNTVTDELILSLELGDRIYNILNVPESDLVVVASVAKAEIAKAGQELALNLIIIAVALAAIATVVVVLLARQLSNPLTNLTNKAKQVAEGDLSIQVELQGTLETYTLGDNFNNLVKQVNNLIQEQTIVAQDRQKQKEALQGAILTLLEEVQDALDGDLTVKASLDSMEMSTVADLINAIIDNLRHIAIEVKKSTTQVTSSLTTNEESIQELTQQAIKEAEATNITLESVQEMSKSIEIVTQNANQAATLADDAFKETQEGTKVMDDTVNSIVSLRTTVGETAKKMKRLGESSQKISQVVSLIEEIALKTNLLAINASVEASRAGEQGQGFTVVAEQVGALAEQSATATKEIAKIVANIQLETQEVTQAMEVGTSQVVDSTRLVEATKKRLENVLARSKSINELMYSISQATVTQTDTSTLVTELMQQIASYSEERLKSSQQVSASMRNTAQVAQKLQSAVEQFKVE